METGSLLPVVPLRVVVGFIIVWSISSSSSSRCEANYHNDKDECFSSCGNISNITNPFRLEGDPKKCGVPRFELACDTHNRTTIKLNSKTFYVLSISYENTSMRLVDPGLVAVAGINNSASYSFPLHFLSSADVYSCELRRSFPFMDYSLEELVQANIPIIYITCPAPVVSDKYIPIRIPNNNNFVSCGSSSSNSSTTSCNNNSSMEHPYSYVLSGLMVSPSELPDSCNIRAAAWASRSSLVWRKNRTPSFSDINAALINGFQLSWFDAFGQLVSIGFVVLWFCYRISQLIGAILVARFALGFPLLMALVVYKWRRRHLSAYDSIEDFLESRHNFMPIRYSYYEIKKMTNGFKHKLGEGGYGTVFKGKLKSSPLVAVKIMGKSKATGQEFINEVATIGTIHHVNVVTLIGFCAQGSKRALVYDFMPNGSLEKYIFQQEDEAVTLSCERMFEISLGVARGINYLHRGCNMQILHFDIKPHNILLDANFIPKISDFGLAKLYSTDDSIVSLTAARGTMGYMAPELFYKNIGGVSYKADVYSYGMLLMEMAGRRKNLHLHAEHSSQIYFPSWAYDQFKEGKDIEAEAATVEEKNMVRKMVIVALWCIQFKPADRPSMNKVVEMLEGDVELLQMPPKPFLSPHDIPAEAAATGNKTPAVSSLAHSDFVDSVEISEIKVE